jgi:hypothetical protein
MPYNLIALPHIHLIYPVESIVLYELMTRFSFPLCTALPHPSGTTPISSTTSIIDLEDVSLGALWRLRNHLQEASRLATANYPETLGTIAVVNSPSFFPTVWGWIKAGRLAVVYNMHFPSDRVLRAGLTKVPVIKYMSWGKSLGPNS